MSKTSDSLSSLLENWKILKEQRPSEADFSNHGFQLSYASLDDYFLRLKTLIDALDSKGYWTSSPEVAVADQPIANALSNVNGLLINARSNGVGWMLNSGFFDALNNARQLITTLTRSQASLTKEIAKVLADRSDADIEVVIAAAATARNIVELEADAKKRSQQLSQDSQQATDSLAALSLTQENLTDLAQQATQSIESIKNFQVESKVARDIIDKLKSESLAQDELLTKRLDTAEKRVSITDEAAKNALDAVKKALKQVRDQGLAGAFQHRSRKLQIERIVWGFLFLTSITLLVVLAIHFTSQLTELTYESLVVNLLRRMGLAAPAIWLGWYSATQLARVSRAQEDYEYKAASALAYQSYRDEIGVLANDALLEKLASIAISTFGDNPVRLYDNTRSEPVTPVQAAIQGLPPEKIAAILAAVGEQTLKSKFWPLGK